MPEGRLVTRELLNVSIEGLGPHHQTSIFPCGIFQYMKGVNDKPGTPNYDLYRLALESTSKRLYPNYVNCQWSVDKNGTNLEIQHKRNVLESLDEETYQKFLTWCKEDEKRAKEFRLKVIDDKIIVDESILLIKDISSSMGCRTYNGYDINFNFKEIIDDLLAGREVNHFSGNQKDGRGNICPATIILPTLAMEADRDVEKFMALLDKKIHEAKDMLIERFEWICSQSPESAKFMYENNTIIGHHPEQGIRSALKHGTLVIGQLGLAETLELLIGCNHTKPEGMKLAKRIEQLFKDRCAEFKNEYKLNFGVYYTPRF